MNGEGIMAEDNSFPAGMHVLAVDNDPTALKILENMLQKCHYKATITTDAETAMYMLRMNPCSYDLVMTDVRMKNMDGFKLLKYVGHKMNLPILMLSDDSDPELIMKGIEHGACDFLAKPIRFEEIKKIWQHVYRRWLKSVRPCPSTAQVNVDFGAAENGGQESLQETEDSRKQGTHGLAWSKDLHGKFIAAVNQLRGDLVTPKRVFELMDVEGITKEHVASHLQKYRQYLRRMDEANGQQSNVASHYGRNNPYDGLANFGALATTRSYPSLYISPKYQQGGILGSISNPIMIDHEIPALSQAIQPYSYNTMFQPVALQTFQSNNHPFDLTYYTSPSWVPAKRREEDQSSP